MLGAFASPVVLITGGAGYIGCHAAEAFAQSGLFPIIYDNLDRGSETLVRRGRLERGDIRDEHRLREVMERYRPSAIIHFAALSHVGESVERPDLYYDVNVCGSLCLLRAALAADIRHVVFSSTCAVYGTPVEQPIREDAPKAPINPYGRSKLIVEQMLDDFSRTYGLRYVALRYFNACGAHPSGELGEMHEPETHLIPRLLMVAAGRLPLVDVMGTDYPTADGTAIRDYIHVCDVADAHTSAFSYLTAGGPSVTLNLGTGRGHSVLEILAAANRITGCDIPVQFGARRPGDAPVLTADATAAQRTLGFTPSWLNIDDTIRTAWQWEQRLAPLSLIKRSGEMPAPQFH